MTRFIPLGLIAVLLFAGCTRVGGGSEGKNAAANPWTHHGVLRMANLSEPDTLNPVVGNQQIDSDLAMIWASFFYNWSDTNEYVPELIREMPSLENGGIAKDGKTITYHLRPGVLWQDGKPFGADDVIFTWHAIMNPKNNVGSRVGYELITAIDKQDEHTIVVHLKAAYAPFVATFFGQSGNPYPVLPAHLLAQLPDINRAPFNSQPIGTGPFIMDKWQRGSKIVFRANPTYWRGAPKLQRIEYSPVPDENTIITQLQSHEIDLEYNGSSAHYKQFTSIPGTVAKLTPFNQYGQLALNLKSTILSDVRVRRALWYGLNVKGLIEEVSHGVNTPGYSDQPDFAWAYNPAVTHYDFDAAKARALLDDAGWKAGPDGIRLKNGKRLAVALAGVSGSATGNAVNVIAQRDWHDIGVETIIKTYVSSLFFASYGAGGIVQTGKFDAAFYSWINGVDPDDATLWMCDQFPPAGQNVYHFCNKELDAAEKTALSSYDRAVRKKAYDRIQAILSDEVPTVITWYNRRISVENTDLKNYRPAHSVTSFWNPWEWEI